MKVSIGAILSFIDGRLMCKFEDVHELMEFLVGGPVWTHQIPMYFEKCATVLHELFPDIVTDEGKYWEEVLNANIKVSGEFKELSSDIKGSVK